MMIAMLHDVITGILVQIMNQPTILRERHGPMRLYTCAKNKLFALAIHSQRISSHARNGGEIHRQLSVQKRPIQPLQTIDGRKRIGVVVAQNYVAHDLASISW